MLHKAFKALLPLTLLLVSGLGALVTYGFMAPQVDQAKSDVDRAWTEVDRLIVKLKVSTEDVTAARTQAVQARGLAEHHRLRAEALSTEVGHGREREDRFVVRFHFDRERVEEKVAA